MVKALMENNRFVYFRCPFCKQQVYHHRSGRESKEEVSHEHKPPTLEKDPFRFFHCLPPEKKEGKMVVALATFASGVDMSRHVVMLDVDRGAELESNKQALTKLLMVLRQPVFTGLFRKKQDMTAVPTLTPNHWSRWAIHEDDRPITEYLFAFLFGVQDIREARQQSKNDVDMKLILLSNCLVVDVALRHVSRFHPQCFQKMLGVIVSQTSKATALHNFLSRVRLATHRTTVRNELGVGAVDRACAGIKVHGRGFLHWMTDTCDFTGGKGKSASWAHILACNYTESQVGGAYSANPEARWNSEDGKDWEEAIACSQLVDGDHDDNNQADADRFPSIVEEVFGVDENEDWKRSSDRWMSHIAAIASEDDLPTREESREIERLERWGDAGKVRRNLGTPLEVPNPKNCASSDLLRDNNNTGNTTTAFWASMYDWNSIEIQVPYHASLNASKTVEDITNSCVRRMERAIQDESEDHSNGKTIQGSVVAIWADGAPVQLYLRLKAEMEAKGVFDWENVLWVSEAFHLLINSLHSLNGRHSQEVLL
jgi:hypothetical protein